MPPRPTENPRNPRPRNPRPPAQRPRGLARLAAVFLAGVVVIIGCSSQREVVQIRTSPGDNPAPGSSSNSGGGGATATNTPSAIASDPSAVRAAALGTSTEPWSFHGAPGRLLSTSFHRVYTTIDEPNTLDALPGFLEALIHRYRTVFVDLPAPSRPLETYLFAERDQWQQHTREIMQERAALYLNLGRGGYAVRGTAVLFDIDETGHRDTFSIIAHEGWHQYTQIVFRHALPTWLEEGIATWMEGRRERRDGGFEFDGLANRARLEMLSTALNTGRLIKLTELLERVPQQFLEEGERDQARLLTYYAQVWALVQFLMEGEDGRYREALGRVLVDAAEGRIVSTILTSPFISGQAARQRMATSVLGPGVVLAYFNRDMAQFDEQYHAYILAIVRRHGTPLRRFVRDVEPETE